MRRAFPKKIVTLSRSEKGFTLIEVLIVTALLGITMTMFSLVFTTTIRRSSDVQTQNILQTEVRAALNQLVTDLRDAGFGDSSTYPVIEYTNNSITFYSPDRQVPWSHMRKIRYWLDGTALKEQVITSTNTNCPTKVCSSNTPGPPWNRNGTDLTTIALPSASDPVRTLVAADQSPLSGDASKSGWAAGQIFRYCIQSPPDMSIDTTNATSPELITWTCTSPTSASQVKTIITRAVISANSNSTHYNYGSIATIRWNAAQ